MGHLGCTGRGLPWHCQCWNAQQSHSAPSFAGCAPVTYRGCPSSQPMVLMPPGCSPCGQLIPGPPRQHREGVAGAAIFSPGVRSNCRIDSEDFRPSEAHWGAMQVVSWGTSGKKAATLCKSGQDITRSHKRGRGGGADRDYANRSPQTPGGKPNQCPGTTSGGYPFPITWVGGRVG